MRTLIQFLSAIALLLAACTDPNLGGTLWPCTSDDDCAGNHVCLAGFLPQTRTGRPPEDTSEPGPDAGPDVFIAPDVAPEIAEDAGPDVLEDVTADSATDAGADTAVDTAADTATDTIPDTKPDVFTDATDTQDAFTCTHECPAEDDTTCVEGRFLRCEAGDDGCRVWALQENCDDANACTTDTCDYTLGCQHAAVECDDGNLCDGDETCDETLGCQEGTPLECDNEDVCDGTETCDPTNGCQDGTPLECDNEDVCDGTETCDPTNGCQDGTPLECDNGDVCDGTETCDPTNGCQDGTPLECDNEDVCDGTETCDPTAGCQAGTPPVCDDDNACNGEESCDSVLGCLPGTPVNCDDGNPCNGVETCVSATGDCSPGEALDCDDGFDCTADGCAPESGCTNEPQDAACDDGNPCTEDSCLLQQGCVHTDAACGCSPSDGFLVNGGFENAVDSWTNGASPTLSAYNAFSTTDADSRTGAWSLQLDYAQNMYQSVELCSEEEGRVWASFWVKGGCGDSGGKYTTLRVFNGDRSFDVSVNCSGSHEDWTKYTTGVAFVPASTSSFWVELSTANGPGSGAHATGIVDDISLFWLPPNCPTLPGGEPDCSDPACFGDQCPEICGDGLDNDGDGAPDCNDGNPCTVDSCDDVLGCSNVAEPDFTPCGEGYECIGGVCQWDGACGDVTCPVLPDYAAYCNDQDHCEYTYDGPDTAAWRQHDVWIFVAPGILPMGAPEGEGNDSERPVHDVTFAAGYFIAKYEVTVAQYDACQSSGECSAADVSDYDPSGWGLSTATGGREAHPQNGLSWDQAGTVCAWSAPGGRLPSEAEWEFAATGPVHRLFPWANDAEPTCSDGVAVFDDGVAGEGCGAGGTQPVGSMPNGNSYVGAADMGGNLWEWCTDWLHDSYTDAPPDGSAWLVPESTNRVKRGGAYYLGTDDMRSAKRTGDPQGQRGANNGVRCLRPLSPVDTYCDVPCPVLPDYTSYCNAQDSCEYAYTGDDTATWREWDVWIWVPPGSFWMGCDEAVDDECSSHELPRHQVDVPGFWIERTEVTNREYVNYLATHGNSCAGQTCVDTTSSDLHVVQNGGEWTTEEGHEDQPVVQVTWYGAHEYCESVGARLCAESEWEKAARGVDGRLYPWGNEDDSCDLAVLDGCGESPQPVGSMAAGASPYGVLDAAGNVDEWQEDDYHADYDGHPDDGGAWVDSPRSTGRMRRGGSWFGSDVRASARANSLPATSSTSYGGFRCCREQVCQTPSCCDDGDPCTDDSWSTTAPGCVSEPSADGTPCGTGMACQAGVCELDYDWVHLEGGEFAMGSATTWDDERPVHAVAVPSFEIGRTEVTVAQFASCLAAGACTWEPGVEPTGNWGVAGREEHPVNYVDWLQAKEFCTWAGGRLPSESEWEYAARSGGLPDAYPWGADEASCDLAAIDDPEAGGTGCGAGHTWPVCSWSPAGDTAQGLCDMIGNVREWTEDDWHDSYDGDGDNLVDGPFDHPADGSAWAELPRSVLRVLRGGSWMQSASQATATWRGGNGTGGYAAENGFRCVRSISPIDLHCGGTACPALPGYAGACNAQEHCEYGYAGDDDATWRQWDVWIFVPPGDLEMGTPELEVDRPKEQPVHDVRFTGGFFVAKYETVVEQYEACEAEGACEPPSTEDHDANGWGTNRSADGLGDHPQNGLAWYQGKNFCAWLHPDGRLPSEAEWEYAANGPAHRKYPWGDTPEPDCTNDTAMFNADGTGAGYGCGTGGTAPVGEHGEGAAWCGALDMAGNVSEWVLDWDHENYEGAPEDGAAWLEPWDGYKVTRGGYFGMDADMIRSAAKSQGLPDRRSAGIGVRCVRPLPCESDAECDDGNPCTADTCSVDGVCESEALPDDNPCGADYSCQDGRCTWLALCGETRCPRLHDHEGYCNVQDHCEYAYAGPDTSTWRQWDTWIWVPPGSFEMGAPETESGSGDDERPVHLVTVAEGYFIAKYEIVVEQYEACVAAGACSAAELVQPVGDEIGSHWGTNRSGLSRETHPQNYIDLYRTQDFCAWLAPTGAVPSEAEWEYAASGPVHRKYPWGDTAPSCTSQLAVFDDGDNPGCGSGGTRPEDEYDQGLSAVGAVHMGGNLMEWVADCWHQNYATPADAPADGTAWTTECYATDSWVYRNGSYYDNYVELRAGARGNTAPDATHYFLGGRCVRYDPCDDSDPCNGVESFDPLLGCTTEVGALVLHETFDTDVVTDGIWQRSDSTIQVDTDTGLLEILSGLGYDDWASTSASGALPLWFAARVRLVSGGSNYQIPYVRADFEVPEEQIVAGMDYPGGADWVWHLRQGSTGFHESSYGPASENVWVDLRMHIDADGGTLWARIDGDEGYVQVGTETWAIASPFAGVSVSQPWDSHCQVDCIGVWEEP